MSINNLFKKSAEHTPPPNNNYIEEYVMEMNAKGPP